MVKRYSHLSSEHLQQYARNMTGIELQRPQEEANKQEVAKVYDLATLKQKRAV